MICLRMICITVFLVLIVPDSFAQQNRQTSPKSLNSVIVYVDDFPPYINSEGMPLGTSAQTLKVLGEYAGIEIDFRYIPYSDATKLLSLQRDVVSFPYFFTKERAEKYYYSNPISLVSIQLYFNRQHNDFENISTINELRIGQVRGNSYGEAIDNLVSEPLIFESEVIAITALMNNQIDVLPMSKGVMDALILKYFAPQKELIKPLKNIQGNEKFHLMAPKTAFGKAIIEKVNNAIALKFEGDEMVESKTEKLPEVDVAELIPAEGFPAIIGKSIKDDHGYTLPIGTKVVVLDWSEAIRKPSSATNINRNMLLTSKVVILNGPHVGKEMMVRNMHIKLE